MFWRFNGYPEISAIETILDKPEFTLEELLDEADLIEEVKQHNSRLIQFFCQDAVLEKLLKHVVAPRLGPKATESTDSAVTSTEAGPESGAGAGAEVDTEANTEAESDFPFDNISTTTTTTTITTSILDGASEQRPGLIFSRPSASSLSSSEQLAKDDDPDKKRNRYAFIASEVLASDTWSIHGALMANHELFTEFWAFLKRPSPLDPLQAGYFTKVNEVLFDKKTEEMIDILKRLPNAVSDLLNHVECPMIMDLLLKIIALDCKENVQGIVEWLYSQDIVPTLVSYLSPERNWVVQTAAGDFLKAIITISANASQNDQQCIGPNELTRQLVSKPCIEQLIGYMLGGGNTLTVGVDVIIEVIRKNNSDYDRDVAGEAGNPPTSRDPIYLGTLLRLFGQYVPDFMNLIMMAPSRKKAVNSTFDTKLEPLGFDRFKTCELMAELLHCSNMGLLNEPGAEEVIAARDLERNRLRSENRLYPHYMNDDLSAGDDLTMRSLHHEESRRLEVTNADEDYEEVEDSNDDFVRAEDEILPITTSFMDKDSDDFVDEPLSSPRLKIKEDSHDIHPEFPNDDQLPPSIDDSSDFSNKDSQIDEPSILESAKAQGDVAPNTDGSSISNEAEIVRAMENVTLDQKPGESINDKDMTVTCSSSEAQAADGSKPESNAAAAAPIQADPCAESQASVDDADPEIVPEPSIVSQADDDKDLSRESLEASTPDPSILDVKNSSQVSEPESSSVFSTGINEDSQLDNTGDRSASALEDSRVPGDRFGNTAETDRRFDAPVVGDFLKMQFVEYNVVPTILSFFFAYPWNNFLHNVVYDIVQQVFNGPMDRGFNPTLAISLFETIDITAAITRGQAASDESQAKIQTRMGYMGHLTLIAEEVVKFTERHAPEVLSDMVLDKVMSQEWINYVDGPLADTRERDNAILGGVRPEDAIRARGAGLGQDGGASSFGLSNSGTNALASVGLNGGMESHNSNQSNIGSFGISTGTLLSGFGSSSDEEDYDETENDEEIKNEFRAYTDPLNNTAGSSLNPPSIPPPPPPPPPPLNITPSRARLQLQARLAMHQKKNAENLSAFNTASENQPSSSHNENYPAATHNPFETDDLDSDDDDDDNDGGHFGMGSAWSSNNSGRGAWWRGAISGGQQEGNSDSDGDMDNDEEFGDFAMPEVESTSTSEASPVNSSGGNNVPILKPLAVHPVSGASTPFGAVQKAGLSSLWPFGPSFSNAGSGSSSTHIEGISPFEAQELGTMTMPEDSEVTGEDGSRVSRTVEAKRRTSLEDPDDEEVVV
ncbi:Extragenic suppressor of kinetochore protein 1 [Ceratocystis platani]|uniref:Extragenic suppressor of kinetochore protein 1 n=1 Tax=Ceratocystis fimbriata f. sp. platani TaxID=88771 RepID=A0A0F8D1H0_CERFI|nr:Extragenic suppressor of kinetochore protein 1 [Ceratocystis platani]